MTHLCETGLQVVELRMEQSVIHWWDGLTDILSLCLKMTEYIGIFLVQQVFNQFKIKSCFNENKVKDFFNICNSFRFSNCFETTPFIISGVKNVSRQNFPLNCLGHVYTPFSPNLI